MFWNGEKNGRLGNVFGKAIDGLIGLQDRRVCEVWGNNGGDRNRSGKEKGCEKRRRVPRPIAWVLGVVPPKRERDRAVWEF